MLFNRLRTRKTVQTLCHSQISLFFVKFNFSAQHLANAHYLDYSKAELG